MAAATLLATTTELSAETRVLIHRVTTVIAADAVPPAARGAAMDNAPISNSTMRTAVHAGTHAAQIKLARLASASRTIMKLAPHTLSASVVCVLTQKGVETVASLVGF
jgi:hypothetical protein